MSANDLARHLLHDLTPTGRGHLPAHHQLTSLDGHRQRCLAEPRVGGQGLVHPRHKMMVCLGRSLTLHAAQGALGQLTEDRLRHRDAAGARGEEAAQNPGGEGACSAAAIALITTKSSEPSASTRRRPMVTSRRYASMRWSSTRPPFERK